MLDTDTRRRIDTARDILVGKVPDPKSQVEQITIALIYKFMDDMDAESEELGGKRTFFAGEFARFGWARLMTPGIGGHEMLNTYAEAITRMPENPGIPPLFRDIFKNAYLPYRDPETLRAFLKIIDDFTYDHSERLGDAFEYLLSVLGSQGDAGQFRTPRHIIDFMVAVVDPRADDTILDPACGTAGFLISAWKHILAANATPSPDGRGMGRGDRLSPDRRKRLLDNVRGYDISPDMVRLSLVNLYLHGFNDPHIFEYDTLTSDERWNEYATVILANPPFMSPKGGIRPHKRFSVQSNRSEVLFVDYIAEHLAPGGRAAIIVPEGVIFQSGNAYKQLRKLLVEEYLAGVISLPAGVFNPYSGVKTSILWLDKTLAKQTDSVLFVKIEADGFDLGAQRKEGKRNDLPDVLNEVRHYQQHAANVGTAFISGSPKLTLVARAAIAANGDYSLSGERYKSNEPSHASLYPLVEIGEICTLEYGKPLKQEDRIAGKYLVWGSNGVVGTHNVYLVEAPYLVVGRKGSAGEVHYSDQNGTPIDTTFYIKLEKEDQVTLKYLFHILKSLNLRSVNVQSGVPGLNRNDAYKVRIPLPPLAEQEALVAELDSYQRIIDGARQVVANWRPRIDVDPAWPVVAFKEAPLTIIDGDRGTAYPKGNEFSSEGYCLFLNTRNVRLDGFNFEQLAFISREKDEVLRGGKLNRGDVILTTRGTVGNTAYYHEQVPYEHVRINSGMLIFRPKQEQLRSDYLFYYFQSEQAQKQFRTISSGSAQPQLPIRDLGFATIPIPDTQTQRSVVVEIQRERDLVQATRSLIPLFEQKIKERLARVWGAEAQVDR